jgi:hypothetical protein
VDAAQAGARTALALVTHDVQLLGAGARAGLFAASGNPGPVALIQVTDSATGPDRLDLLLVDPAVQTQLLNPFSAGAVVVSGNPTIAPNDQIQITDLNTAALYQVVSVAGGLPSSTLQVSAPTNPLPQSYPAGSWVFRLRAVSYFIDASTFGADDPLLMFDPDGAGPQPAQPLAEGIEDLQIALGFDLDGDGAIRSVGAAPGDDEWIYNVAGETAPANLSLLRAVRVTLVARTVLAGSGTRGQRPAAEDHPGAAQSDAYPRRLLRSEIAVRNFNL